jgi:alkanesulfonate monooxygenase SsuD/methylene tetrahydromethanopterin reductase-like flavin-dependent oxidoreductase (luciferase family)
MEPTPTAPVPIYVGGLSEVAFARAARHDGWIGDMYPTEEAIGWATRLAEVRSAAGAEGDFSVFVALTDAFLPEHFERAERGGVTDCMTMPWMYYSGRDATLDQKLEALERFAKDVIAPLAGRV